MDESVSTAQRSRSDYSCPSVSNHTRDDPNYDGLPRNTLSRRRIILLVQANLWLAGRFVLYLIDRFHALVKRLEYLLSQSAAALLALSAVLGNSRHPITRFVLAVTAFFTLWSYLKLPIYLALPAVLGAGGVFEQYFPTSEMNNPYSTGQKVELEEL